MSSTLYYNYNIDMQCFLYIAVPCINYSWGDS